MNTRRGFLRKLATIALAGKMLLEKPEFLNATELANQDVELYHRLPFYFAKLHTFNHPTLEQWNKILPKDSYKSNMGNTKRSV